MTKSTSTDRQERQVPKDSNPSSDSRKQISVRSRYLQLLMLLTFGGAIYPMLYLRQIYQTTMLTAFNISDLQLGQLYSMLGLLFLLTYGPSGWLADRVRPMLLITISMIGTGLLGLWYATLPSFTSLLVIFAGWGVTSGLTFWGAVMKRIKILAGDSANGRFYGIYDGGRGLVEAALAGVALFIFASISTPKDPSFGEGDVVAGLQYVIHMYSWVCIGLGVLSAMFVPGDKTIKQEQASESAVSKNTNLIADILFILKQKEVWLIALIISAGYHIFWATYSFSAYLQESNLGFTAVMAGTITTIKLWMRPIGGAAGGFLGDKFSNLKVLNLSLILSALGLIGLVISPTLGMSQGITIAVLIFFILFVGLLTYAIRGLYWAIIEHLKVPQSKLGLTIGIISVIGYCPDVFIPLVNGYIINAHQNNLQVGYQWYFGYTAAMVVTGIIACSILGTIVKNRKKNS